MPTYKLTYFDTPSRGEPIRWLLSYLGEDFVDNRPSIAEWQSMKKDVLFGKLPILDVDGERLYQTGAIYRYLGQKAKLVGDNELENARIDYIQGTLDDLRAAIQPVKKAQGEEREKLMNQLKTETIPYYLNIYNDRAKSGYVANGKLSWADISLVSMIEWIETITGASFLDHFPNLKQLKEKVVNLAGIKQWLAKRP